jgi:hypothetical protein
MEKPKIQFSDAEMELLCNKDIILTKNKALEKVKQLLGNLQDECQTYILKRSILAQHEIFSFHPKISKGENYLGLPYLILDYPRCFQQQNIFAVRTMLWWGNFYSTTLHIAGRFKSEFANKIENASTFLSNGDYFIGINPNPWVHHFEESNYARINTLNKEEFLRVCNTHEHIKLAVNTSINSNKIEEKLANSWKDIITLCFD